MTFSPTTFRRRVLSAMSLRSVTIKDAATQMNIPRAALSRVVHGQEPRASVYLAIVDWCDRVDGSLGNIIPVMSIADEIAAAKAEAPTTPAYRGGWP